MAGKSIQAIKRPVQARSIARFEKMLDAAEELMLEIGIDATSHHKIAERAQVPSASVYQYFPSPELIFQALAERHFKTVMDLTQRNFEGAEVRNWRDLVTVLVDTTYEYYSTDRIGAQLFLGVHSATNVRLGAAGRLTEFGAWVVCQFESLPDLPVVDDLQEKLAICANLSDAVYACSLFLHDEILPRYRDEAQRVIEGYLGTYFEP